MLDTWTLAVFGLMNSCSAIWWLSQALASSWSTSRSRVVSGSTVGRPARGAPHPARGQRDPRPGRGQLDAGDQVGGSTRDGLAVRAIEDRAGRRSVAVRDEGARLAPPCLEHVERLVEPFPRPDGVVPAGRVVAFAAAELGP
jgi:hypothetical protein